MKQVELAQRLGISKSYLSMILKANRRLTPELAEKLQQVPGVHRVVNFQALGLLHTQEVTGSNPVLPTIAIILGFLPSVHYILFALFPLLVFIALINRLPGQFP